MANDDNKGLLGSITKLFRQAFGKAAPVVEEIRETVQDVAVSAHAAAENCMTPLKMRRRRL